MFSVPNEDSDAEDQQLAPVPQFTDNKAKPRPKGLFSFLSRQKGDKKDTPSPSKPPAGMSPRDLAQAQGQGISEAALRRPMDAQPPVRSAPAYNTPGRSYFQTQIWVTFFC